MTIPQATIPSRVSQASDEDIVWGIDCTAILTDPQTPVIVALTLEDPRGENVTLVDGPAVDANVVLQRIQAGVLSKQSGVYRLIATVNPSDTTDVLAQVLEISCQF